MKSEILLLVYMLNTARFGVTSNSNVFLVKDNYLLFLKQTNNLPSSYGSLFYAF